MSSKSEIIFGNPIDKGTIEKGRRSQAKFRKKFGDDSKKIYHFSAESVPTLASMGVQKLVLSDQPFSFPANALIIGNIRMGFGHYRISMAMASCAQALGYTPYWLDLASFDATGSKMIRYQNDLYSTGSKISQKSPLFNRSVWEPMNSEGFRKLSYNSVDQANAELLVPLFHDLPKDIPYIATHVWPAQAAIHAGLTHVVNAIPDNWPMALHLAEGAIHTVQTPFAYLGYKMLNGMGKSPLKGMPEQDLYEVGHYVDDELVRNIDTDSELREQRVKNKEPLRFLLTVGGAGAGEKQFLSMIEHLLPKVLAKEATLFLNFGDHLDMYEYLCKSLPDFKKQALCFFNDYRKLNAFVATMDKGVIGGIYAIDNQDIFAAVYSTNLLMRKCDVLITKPSELAYYPIPKIFMRHIGGHEVYGAVHGQEEGDATFECDTPEKMNAMIDRIIEDKELYLHLVHQIQKLNSEGMYNGAYEAVKLAVKGRQ
jgi:hypothetical protein